MQAGAAFVAVSTPPANRVSRPSACVRTWRTRSRNSGSAYSCQTAGGSQMWASASQTTGRPPSVVFAMAPCWHVTGISAPGTRLGARANGYPSITANGYPSITGPEHVEVAVAKSSTRSKSSARTSDGSKGTKGAKSSTSSTDVPATLARSDDHAQAIFTKVHDAAVDSYGEGERAHRTAFAALKHSYEKVGDHWEPKDQKGPSDDQAAKGGA